MLPCCRNVFNITPFPRFSRWDGEKLSLRACFALGAFLWVCGAGGAKHFRVFLPLDPSFFTGRPGLSMKRPPTFLARVRRPSAFGAKHLSAEKNEPPQNYEYYEYGEYCASGPAACGERHSRAHVRVHTPACPAYPAYRPIAANVDWRRAEADVCGPHPAQRGRSLPVTSSGEAGRSPFPDPRRWGCSRS